MAVIGGFRSDLSITRKTDGNFRFRGCFVFQSRVSRKTVVKQWESDGNAFLFRYVTSVNSTGNIYKAKLFVIQNFIKKYLVFGELRGNKKNPMAPSQRKISRCLQAILIFLAIFSDTNVVDAKAKRKGFLGQMK